MDAPDNLWKLKMSLKTIVSRKIKVLFFPTFKALHDRLNDSTWYLELKQLLRSTRIFKIMMLILSFPFISTKKYQYQIAPQVNDEFAAAIARVLEDDSVNSIIEVGASSGGGSTQVIIDKVLKRKQAKNLKLYLIEVSPMRSEVLKKIYEHLNFVEVINKSTVTPSDHVTPRWLLEFNQRNSTILRNRSIFKPLRWLRQDIKFLQENPVLWNPTAFEAISGELGSHEVDFALIDGGFCGLMDTQKVLGARYIALDDINDPKNYDSYNLLQSDNRYQLVDSNFGYRNGYAVFKRTQDKDTFSQR